MMDHYTRQTYDGGTLVKTVTSICLVLLAIAAIAAWNAPAQGYEPSIYSATPPVFWAAVGFSIACGAGIVLTQVYRRSYEHNQRWLLGFLLLFLSFALCLALFIIRGYYLWDINGDEATHLGYINQIFSEGHAPEGLFGSFLIYPVAHFYTVEIALLLGTGVLGLIKLIPLYLAMLFVGFTYVFARAFLPEKGQAILAASAACLIATEYYAPFYLGFMPYLLANFYFPLALFAVFKYLWTRKAGWGVLSLLILFASTPFHPILCIALIATLLAIWALERFLLGAHRLRVVGIANAADLRKNHVPLVIVAFLAGWFVLWYSRFPSWENTVNGLMNLIEFGGQTHVTELLAFTTTAEQYGYNVVEYALRTELGVLAVATMALLSLPFIVRKVLKTRSVDYTLLLFAPLAVISVSIVGLYFLNIGFGPMRMLFYIFAISLLFVGYGLFGVLQYLGSSKRRFAPLACLGVLLVLVVAIFGNGVLSLYPSPYLLKSNDQTTKHDALGMSWLFRERTMNATISSMGIAPYRFGDALLSPEENKAQMLPRVYPSMYAQKNISLTVPYHFGYDGNSTLATAFKYDVYLMLTARDLSVYRDVFPDMAEHRFTDADYTRLNNDTGLARLYSNGEMDAWFAKHKYVPV